MRSKKLLLPVILLIVSIFAMTAYCILSNIAQKPTITEKEFAFSITYVMNGETKTINGSYIASFAGNGGYVGGTERMYTGKLVGVENAVDASIVLEDTDDRHIVLQTQFFADHMLGDPEYDHFDDAPFEPHLTYYNWATNEDIDGQDFPDLGIKIVSWEYPEPIENSFVFSHISYMSSLIVIPLALIGILTVLAMIIFVKKEKDLASKPLDVVCVILNFAIAIALLPFATAYGCLSDINGTETVLYHQLGYFMPALILLSIAASIGLRRKGFSKSGFVAQFVGPVCFGALVVYLLCNAPT